MARRVKVSDENLTALIAAMEAVQSGKTTLSDEELGFLHFALGKSYDDIGDYEKAFPYFLEGCRLERGTFDYVTCPTFSDR